MQSIIVINIVIIIAMKDAATTYVIASHELWNGASHPIMSRCEIRTGYRTRIMDVMPTASAKSKNDRGNRFRIHDVYCVRLRFECRERERQWTLFIIYIQKWEM